MRVKGHRHFQWLIGNTLWLLKKRPRSLCPFLKSLSVSKDSAFLKSPCFLQKRFSALSTEYHYVPEEYKSICEQAAVECLDFNVTCTEQLILHEITHLFEENRSSRAFTLKNCPHKFCPNLYHLLSSIENEKIFWDVSSFFGLYDGSQWSPKLLDYLHSTKYMLCRRKKFIHVWSMRII